jgi:beta-glucosidase
MHRLIRRVDRDYGHPPLYITENGCAENSGPGPDGRVPDADRVRYLQEHLGQVARAIDGGCDVRGYFAWSLLDNVEWAAGFTQRFGLVWVDLEGDRRRIVKDSGWWLRDLVAGAPLEYEDEGD